MALLLNGGNARDRLSYTSRRRPQVPCIRKAQGTAQLRLSRKASRHASCRSSCLGWTVHRRFDKCTAPGRLRSVPRSPERRGCVAQLVEQLTLNQRVQGSNPCTPTKDISGLGAYRESPASQKTRLGST